ncbi:MAG: phosphatidate cytidylyltransferase [Novosphingobium sp.]
MTNPTARKSDLGVRTLSAVVMLAVAGTALWLGGWWWNVFALAVGAGVYFEWVRLSLSLAEKPMARIIWLGCGAAYVGTALLVLAILRSPFFGPFGIWSVLCIIIAVIAVDVGAYFVGRTVGGPKIAPAISPSKTWAGLGGGILGATLAFIVPDLLVGGVHLFAKFLPERLLEGLATGGLVAIIAQSGDFFESWMKRRAGVKDSGNLIPGHGGLFDRVDGLLAVLFVIGVVMAFSRYWAAP